MEEEERMDNMLGGRHRLAVAAAVLTAALALAACGSSKSGSSSNSSSSSKSSTTAAASIPPYDGPETKYFGTVPEPTKKPGSPTIGFLQVFGGQPVLAALQNALVGEVRKLGGKTIALDAQLNPQKQVSQFNQLFAQKVDAIIVMPTNADAIEPSLKQAKARGIPVIGFMDPPSLDKSLNPLIKATVNVGYDYAGYSTMKLLATKAPGSNFALLGSSIPNSSLKLIDDRLIYWGKRLGLKYLGRQDSPTDTPTGMAPPAHAILTKYPDVKNIVTYNDESSLAVATAVTEAGKSGINIANSNDGQNITGAAIKAGRMTGAYFVPYTEIGRDMAMLAYDVVTKQPIPAEAIVPKSRMVTKANVDQFSYFK
jgi:ribose transport system substrate-binding protein